MFKGDKMADDDKSQHRITIQINIDFPNGESLVGMSHFREENIHSKHFIEFLDMYMRSAKKSVIEAIADKEGKDNANRSS